MAVPAPAPEPAPAVVLVEGRSDVAAVAALLRRTGGYDGVDLHDLGGITNIRRDLTRLRAGGDARRVLGLFDVAESRFVAGALREVGHDVSGAEARLAALGFHACDRDLEEELVRALGVERAVGVLEELGLGPALDQFRHQPAWRNRPEADQLRRFAGVVSGRKAVVAAALADAVPLDRLPPPIAALLADVREGSGIRLGE